jgi:hypothetical protein
MTTWGGEAFGDAVKELKTIRKQLERLDDGGADRTAR